MVDIKFLGLKVNDKQFRGILDAWIYNGDEWAWYTIFKVAKGEIGWIGHTKKHSKRDKLGRFTPLSE